MATFKLLALPPELQTAVIDCIFRPKHLAQVCLVSKQLQRIALPLLYRDFSINVSEWSEIELERFLARGHSGHAHIRSIEVDSEDLEGEAQALKVAKDALQVLPRNSLRSFRCPLEQGIDNDLVILLAAQQRKLSYICIGPLQANAFNLIDALKPWPPHVDSIVVPWRLLYTEDYAFYHELIERSRNRLKALTVRVKEFEWLDEPEWLSNADNDNDEACEELARGLFGHVKKDRYDRPPLELRDINFQNQNLSAFDNTWAQYIDLARLRTLQVWNCYRTNWMLGCLIDLAKSQTLRLEGLVISIEDQADSPLLTPDFLESISGLRYLNLCYVPLAGSGRFDVQCLKSHADTIQDLYLGIGTNSLAVNAGASTSLRIPKYGDVFWLAKWCRNLKQLGISMPELRMDDAQAGRWGEYLEHLITLADLPRLKVLRVLTWPIDCNHGNYYPETHTPNWPQNRIQYLAQLDTIADSIARLFSGRRKDHHDRLSVITFGNAEQRDQAPTLTLGPMRMDKPITYKIRRVESEFGMLLETVRMDPAEMQYEEPIAYVYDEDTDQGLSLESYPWGNVNGPR